MLQKYLIGVDLGTSATKAALYQIDGKLIAHVSPEVRPGDDELTTLMLSDMDRWIMDQLTSSVAVGKDRERAPRGERGVSVLEGFAEPQSEAAHITMPATNTPDTSPMNAASPSGPAPWLVGAMASINWSPTIM